MISSLIVNYLATSWATLYHFQGLPDLPSFPSPTIFFLIKSIPLQSPITVECTFFYQSKKILFHISSHKTLTFLTKYRSARKNFTISAKKWYFFCLQDCQPASLLAGIFTSLSEKMDPLIIPFQGFLHELYTILP